MKSGDRIKFGPIYCNENYKEYLEGKTIMLTPQVFEYDNDLYFEYQDSPGIFEDEEEGPESIYHLFGNNLDKMLDCVLIPATEEDLETVRKITEEKRLKMEKEADDFVKFVENEQLKEMHLCCKESFKDEISFEVKWEGPFNDAKDDAEAYCGNCSENINADDWSYCPKCGVKLLIHTITKF